MPDPTSDLTFRPESVRRAHRNDEAWEAVVREELVKLRRRSPSRPRVVRSSMFFGETSNASPIAIASRPL